MKKNVFSAAAALSVALGAVAQQGNFLLDNSALPNGLAADAAGNWYNGMFGMEVWVLKDASLPEGINLSPAPGSGDITYAAIQAAGFVKEATYTNRGTAGPGTFSLGQVFLPHAHYGGTVVVAVAAWNSSAPSWSAMRASANQGTRAGVVVLEQPTLRTYLNPGVPPVLAMNQDLVMTGVPQPSALAAPSAGTRQRRPLPATKPPRE